MELYHATSYKRGCQILDNGFLNTSAPRVYTDGYSPTTKGYIYLSTDITTSVYYGNITAIKEQDERIIIFCVDIEESKLEPDYDEIEYVLKFWNKTAGFKDINNPTLDESLKYALSCRIKNNINLKDHCIKYATITSGCAIMEDKIKESLQTISFVGLVNHHNDRAKKQKEEFITKIKWVKYQV